MNIIDNIAREEELYDSFIHKNALKLYQYIGDDNDYIAKLCYYLSSNLDPNYMGENVYNILPDYDKKLSREENKNLDREAKIKNVLEMINILFKCSGNLINPNTDFDLKIRNNLILEDKSNEGSFGDIYLIDGYTVKAVDYGDLGLEFSSLIKETTILSMLGRLKFIGMNDQKYYIGMKYYPKSFYDGKKLNIENNFIAMKDLADELLLIHSLGIIHRDIKLSNICIDKDNHCKIIDFGSASFGSFVNNKWTFHGTHGYKDYLLLGEENEDKIFGKEIDIYSLGIIFYIIEKKDVPWDILSNDHYQKINIENNWHKSMKNMNKMIKGMLSLNKDDRWTIDRIIRYIEYKFLDQC